MGFASAVNLRPTMGPAGTEMLSRHELEFFLELRIAHDLVPQRAAARSHDLDHSLHSLGQRSASLQFPQLVSYCSRRPVGDAAAGQEYKRVPARGIATRLQKAKHHVSVNKSSFRVTKGAGQRADDSEPELLPKMDG